MTKQLFNRLATFSSKHFPYKLRRYSLVIVIGLITTAVLLVSSSLSQAQAGKAHTQPPLSYTQALPSSTLSIATALNIFPDPAIQGQKLQASYTLKNTGTQAVKLPMLLVGTRDSNGSNVDFPVVSNVTIGGGQSYTYLQSITLSALGSYTAWPAAYFNDTYAELGPRITFTASTCTPTYGSFGPGSWPPACSRPYAESSPFNTPLPANPHFASNSQQIVDRVLGDISVVDRPENLVAKADGTGGEPTYYSQPTDPEYTLKCTMTKSWGVCPIEGDKIRIPRGVQVEGNSAAKETDDDTVENINCNDPEQKDRYTYCQPDSHLTIVDQASGFEYDLWQVHRASIYPEDGTNLRFSWGGKTRIDGNGLGSSGTASHFGSLAGRISAEDLQAGQINHALFIVIDCDNGKAVFPAYEEPDGTSGGRSCSQVDPKNNPGIKKGTPEQKNENAPPMGTRFQLVMSPSDIEALPVQKWKKTILQAIAKYGAFFGDTGTGGLFALSPEAGNQYTSVGSYRNKWFEFGKLNWEAYTPQDNILEYVGKLYNTSDDPDPQLDWLSKIWRNLRVIDPCVTKGTC